MKYRKGESNKGRHDSELTLTNGVSAVINGDDKILLFRGSRRGGAGKAGNYQYGELPM